MTKWTRGPWRWDVQDGEIYGQPDDVVVVYRGGLQFESDADLIAAAPELYEALEDCLNWIDYMSLAGPATDTTKARIEAALAKARGEQ